jgi:hypothetical protein
MLCQDLRGVVRVFRPIDFSSVFAIILSYIQGLISIIQHFGPIGILFIGCGTYANANGQRKMPVIDPKGA